MDQLKITDLDKSYDGKTLILKKINLSVKKGEFVVLVGPSGCGKSTLLRSIAGLEEITGGEINIAGKVVNTLPPAERDIAMVFQDYALYPHMTVRQNLSFGLKMRKVNQETIDKEVDQAAKMLDIDHLLDRKPSQMSGGQRQRVAIGRAIVRHASLFLFDEPLSNLDAKLRSQTRIELAALTDKIGATSIYVTHDQVEAMTLADKIVVLDQGIVQQIGSPMDLYNEPANTFVASFIGSPSMNFIKGELAVSEGKKTFKVGDIEIDFSNTPTPAESGTYKLGLRPESIKVLPPNDPSFSEKSDFEIAVVLREPHGHESHVVGTVANQQLLLRSANPARLKIIHAAKKGDLLKVNCDRSALHWFSAETGKRVKVN